MFVIGWLAFGSSQKLLFTSCFITFRVQYVPTTFSLFSFLKLIRYSSAAGFHKFPLQSKIDNLRNPESWGCQAQAFLKPDCSFTSSLVRKPRPLGAAPPLPQSKWLLLWSCNFTEEVPRFRGYHPMSLLISLFVFLFKLYCFYIWMAQLSCGIKSMHPKMCPRWISCLPFDLNFCLVNLCGLDTVRSIFSRTPYPHPQE